MAGLITQGINHNYNYINYLYTKKIHLKCELRKYIVDYIDEVTNKMHGVSAV